MTTHWIVDVISVMKGALSVMLMERRTQLGEYLGHHDAFALAAMHAYVDAERLEGLTLDAALRVLLRNFRLPGARLLWMEFTVGRLRRSLRPWQAGMA